MPISSLNDRVVPAVAIFGPAADPAADQAADLVSRITADPRLRRVAQLAEVSGLSERKLHWGSLAADLGYADQAHLTRDFTATLGVPPSRYAAGRR